MNELVYFITKVINYLFFIVHFIIVYLNISFSQFYKYDKIHKY